MPRFQVTFQTVGGAVRTGPLDYITACQIERQVRESGCEALVTLWTRRTATDWELLKPSAHTLAMHVYSGACPCHLACTAETVPVLVPAGATFPQGSQHPHVGPLPSGRPGEEPPGEDVVFEPKEPRE